MKKIIVLIILLLSEASLAQSVGWTDLMETNITVGNNDYDIFTNRYGNHIIVKETSALKYYKMDVEGNIESSTDLETSTTVVSPSISGDATSLYVVYRKGTEDKIRTQYSNNGGVSWSYISDLNLSGTPSSIECVFSKNKLHVTFIVGTTVYFNFYDINIPGWLTQSISVSETFSASNTRICVWNAGSNNLVYFTFNVGSSMKWRKYVVGGSMSLINNIIASGGGPNIGTGVDDTYIYSFQNQGPNNNIFTMYVRRIEDNWYLGSGNFNNNTNVGNIFSTITASNIPYTAAWSTVSGYENSIVRMGFNGSTSLVYDLIYSETGLEPVHIVNLSSVANDVHVVWQDNFSDGNLRYKYYDDIPLVPENLDVEIYTSGNNNYPKLKWDLNIEPDVYLYENSIDIYRRISIRGGPWSSWAHLDYADGN